MSSPFKYSSRDFAPVAVGILSPVLLSAIALTFGRVSLATTGGLLVVYWVVYTMLFYGYHHHAHTPFLKSRRANRALDVLYSIGVGQPYSFYAYYHMRHHTESVLRVQRYDTIFKHTPFVAYLATADIVGVRWLLFLFRAFAYRRAAQGTPVYKPRSPEKYSWHFSTGEDPATIEVPYRPSLRFPAFLEEYLKVGALRGQMRQMTFEALAIVALNGTLIALRPSAWILMLSLNFALTLWRTWTDYVDHHGVDINDTKRNSFSCYATWFNALTFNNGYHLEHHRYPGIHWTQIAKCREKMPPEAERYVAPIAQWLSPLFLRRVP